MPINITAMNIRSLTARPWGIGDVPNPKPIIELDDIIISANLEMGFFVGQNASGFAILSTEPCGDKHGQYEKLCNESLELIEPGWRIWERGYRPNTVVTSPPSSSIDPSKIRFYLPVPLPSEDEFQDIRKIGEQCTGKAVLLRSDILPPVVGYVPQPPSKTGIALSTMPITGSREDRGIPQMGYAFRHFNSWAFLRNPGEAYSDRVALYVENETGLVKSAGRIVVGFGDGVRSLF